MLRKRLRKMERGQTLVEFAIVIIVLLLILFIIVELGRILWAWVTVQNAARSGARYAVTGQFDTDCTLEDPPCTDPRLIGITQTVENRLTGLPLNDEEGRTYEDDFAYFIEVYGINEFGELQPDFAGIPGQPMAIRVIYNVPIIMPILNGIVENVPVMGQVVQNNELFGQVGGITQGQSVAPNLPPVPTAGPTPTPTDTPTPTPTGTPTAGPSPTPTYTPTTTNTPTPIRCNVQIEDADLVEGITFINITGDVGTTVRIVDGTDGVILDTVTLGGPFADHSCQGYILAQNLSPLLGGHVILLESSDGSFDAKTVQLGTSTPTLVPTDTPQPTDTPTLTPSTTPTPTPLDPTIVLDRDCTVGPDIQFVIRGFSWDTNQAINLFWGGTLQATIPPGHSGFFQQTWRLFGVTDDTYTVEAISGDDSSSANILLPCEFADTPTPTTTPLPPTPRPSDLIVVGPPQLASSPPLVSYEPITFTVTISNVGEVDIESQFFVDLFFDVPPSAVSATEIDVNQYSNGYLAITGLDAQATRDVVIHIPAGFQGVITATRSVHAMVDSVFQVSEEIEDNNVSTPSFFDNVTPGPTPTATSTPVVGTGETDVVAGLVRSLIGGSFVPQARATIYLVLVDPSTAPDPTKFVVGTMETDIRNGFYFFEDAPVPAGDDYYEVWACADVDDETRVGSISPVIPPDPFANIIVLTDPLGCPYE